MESNGLAAAITLLIGCLLVAGAALSLRSESRIRRLYGVDATDENAVRANATVVGLCGIGMCAFAAAIYFGVSARLVGTVTVVVSAGLCIVLGWLIRYRDRRELLTTPNVDRATARRLGGAAILCGGLVLPLAPAIWLRAGPGLLLGIALGGSFVSLFAVAYAYG